MLETPKRQNPKGLALTDNQQVNLMNRSYFQKGHIPHNKGKHLSQKTKDKISKNNAHYWLGKKMPEHVGKKIRQQKLGKKRNVTWGDNISKSLMGHKGWNKGQKWSEEHKIKLRQRIERTHNRIIEEVKEFERQGFRCVPTGGKIRPDFIAIKNNKVYAVEVEYGRPNYSKYTDDIKQYVDDIIWILKKETSTTTIRTVKKTEDIV